MRGIQVVKERNLRAVMDEIDGDDESFLVYEAAEDSWLLASTVVEEIPEDAVVLDVGCGSGYIAETIGESVGVAVIGVDVNPHACEETFARGIPTVRGDLVSCFSGGVFDVVVFNPPYLPENPELAWDDWFDVAIVGGESGREVIERFIRQIREVLAEDGVVYMLVSSVTGLEAVRSLGRENGFVVSVIAEERYPGETLSVLKFE